MNKKLMVPLIVVALVLLVAMQSIFFVSENQRAIVLQLGEAVESEPRMPGINFKLPFIQSVVYFENRVLAFEIEKTDSLTKDLKVLEIDNYVCWRITDPIMFYRKLRSEAVAMERLRNIVYSQLRTVVGNNDMNKIVIAGNEDTPGGIIPQQDVTGDVAVDDAAAPEQSPARRSLIMSTVLTNANQEASSYGVRIVDVRIKRMDLPTPNRQAIFQRMTAERLRMANKYRSEGESEKLRIISEAEKQRDEMLAKANRESLIIRGEADAKAIEIFADALSRDPEFYDFTKSLELYKKSFKDNTRIIFSSDDPLLKYMN